MTACGAVPSLKRHPTAPWPRRAVRVRRGRGLAGAAVPVAGERSEERRGGVRAVGGGGVVLEQTGDVCGRVSGEDELRREGGGVDTGRAGGGVSPVHKGHAAVVVADHVVGPQVAVNDAVSVGAGRPGGFQFSELRQAVTGGRGEIGGRVRDEFVPAVQGRRLGGRGAHRRGVRRRGGTGGEIVQESPGLPGVAGGRGQVGMWSVQVGDNDGGPVGRAVDAQQLRGRDT